MTMTTMRRMLLTLLLFALLLLPPSIVAALSYSADCSSCDHSLTQPVYYGCIGGDVAYVTFDSVRIDCGAALSLNTTSSIPRFHYPDAEADALYALLLVDTTGIDPIVGTEAPFLPFPILHYGGMNIPGSVLVEGMTLDIFDYDETGVTVRPFVSYVEPVPSEGLKKVQPNYTPPDLNTRAFNYEFILGKQRYKKDPPLMDKNTNWEFIGFLKRTILGNPVASTYFTTGYCVKDVAQESAAIDNDNSAIGVDCPVPAETRSGIGSVPAHVAGVGGYGSSLSNGVYGSSSSGSTESGGSGEMTGSGDGGGAAGAGSGSAGSGSDVSSGGTDSTGGSEGNDAAAPSSSGFVNRWGSAAAISCMAGLSYCTIGV